MSRQAIYLIRAANGLTKIGRAASPKHRLCRLRCESPIPVELIHASLVGSAATVEAELHAEFAAVRAHGEWFRLSDGDVAGIIARFPASDVPRSAGKCWVLLGLSPADRDRVRAAARVQGLPMTQFFIFHGLAAAEKILGKSPSWT